MATCHTPFGSFDFGAQYFTARDARFIRALQTALTVCKPWSANTVRVLDAQGRITESDLPAQEAHWVPAPAMDALPKHWAKPLVDSASVEFQTRVTRIERDAVQAKKWQLRTQGPQDEQHVFSGFDAVLLAIPSGPSLRLLEDSKLSPSFQKAIAQVEVSPCWTLMLAFPQAAQPNLSSLGPQWNAARSTHHRIAWLARESSKPQRLSVERWTVQASVAWSHEHFDDDVLRVQDKLLKAFTEVTGIRAEPSHVEVKRWQFAQTSKPVGKTHLWDAKSGIGVCGDYLTGCRVEDAFVSGLELALAVA
jgi:predicted NAD/FAD-dependent oxidoreductase